MDLPQSQYAIEGEVLNWGRCRCALCGKKGKMGNTIKPTPQHPVLKIVCFDCTVQEMAGRLGISAKEAKERHERSMKTQERLVKMIIEQYEAKTGKKPPKNMEALSEIVQPGINWWQQTLSTREREDIEVLSKDEQKEVFRKAPLIPEPRAPMVRENHVGRNDPCPCGSGKKYKKCCLASAA